MDIYTYSLVETLNCVVLDLSYLRVFSSLSTFYLLVAYELDKFALTMFSSFMLSRICYHRYYLHKLYILGLLAIIEH